MSATARVSLIAFFIVGCYALSFDVLFSEGGDDLLRMIGRRVGVEQRGVVRRVDHHRGADPLGVGFDDGENLFQIAGRCNVPVERLMALNDFATPFSVNSGDRVVIK